MPAMRKQASAQLSQIWSNPTYLYFKTHFLGGIFGNSQHVVKVRKSLGLGILLPGLYNIQYEENPRNDPLWLENLICAFLNFPLIITEEITKFQRGAVISVWRPKCPRRALGIYWGGEKEGDLRLCHLLSCEQGTGNWDRNVGSQWASPVPDHSGEFRFSSEGCSRFPQGWFWRPHRTSQLR